MTESSRRAFLKRMGVLAFTVPVITSFTLDASAEQVSFESPNQFFPNQFPTNFFPNQTFPNQYGPEQLVPNQF
jgi:hypothetical protein